MVLCSSDLKIFSLNDFLFPSVKKLWFESQRSETKTEAKTELKGQIHMLERRNEHGVQWPSFTHHSLPMLISFPYAHWVSSLVMRVSAWVSMSPWSRLSPCSVDHRVLHKNGGIWVFQTGISIFFSHIPSEFHLCYFSLSFCCPFSGEDWGRPPTSSLKSRMLA